tara:strand:- start:27 stop:614 length:588 start_codon:yes stop_codon:yes gene_type:complete
MKLILIANKNMDFPCVAEFTDGTRQITNSVFKGTGIKYYHYYLASIGSKKIGDWILNVHSEYEHKELCKIDNEIELARCRHGKARIDYSSDPKLEMSQFENIDSFLKDERSILDKIKQLNEAELVEKWNSTSQYENVNSPTVDEFMTNNKSIKEMMTQMENKPVKPSKKLSKPKRVVIWNKIRKPGIIKRLFKQN